MNFASITIEALIDKDELWFMVGEGDQLDNIFQQQIKCNGADMSFLFPELKTNT